MQPDDGHQELWKGLLGLDIDIVILGLRLAASACLMLFVAMVGYMLWRDFQQVAEANARRPRPTGRLVVMDSAIEGVEVGQAWPLDAVTTVGQAPTSTIPLNIATDQALVMWREGRWWLWSLNGAMTVTLNDEPLHAPMALASGDVIKVGAVALRVELDELL
jgi:hypothetical protein